MFGSKCKKSISGRFGFITMAGSGLLVVAIVLVAVTMAGAYVLQGAHVLELMVQTLSKSKAKTLQVEQVVTIEDPESADHSVTVSETLAYAFPDRFRSDARFEQTHRIFVSARGEHLSIVDDKWQADQPNRYDRYKDLLLLHSRSLLHKALLTYGVDVGTTSLGRFEDRIVYVIGARYPDDSVSQVWVDKEFFLPLRWLSADPENPTASMEFIYRRWRKNGELWYPAQIETYYQKQLIRTILASKVQVDSALSPELWDVAHLKTLYLPEAAPTDSEQPEADVDGVQQAIESFQKKFEP